MRISSAPYLGDIRGGAQLRSLLTKIQSYAAINWRNGGDFGPKVLAPFYDEMLKIRRNDHGHPADGPYLGMGVRDPRAQLYHVFAAVRMYGGTNEKQLIDDFLNFFRSAAMSLQDRKSDVAELRILSGGKPDVIKVPYNESFLINWVLRDAEGVRINASEDNPLLGYTKLTCSEDPVWEAVYGSQYSGGAAGMSRLLPGTPGAHTITGTYSAGSHTVTGTFEYIRLNEDGTDPTEKPPVEPETKGKNGVAA